MDQEQDNAWEATIIKDVESDAPDNAWEATIIKDTPEVSELESGARGLAQGASLGYSDEITGGLEALWDKAINGDKAALIDLYRKNRDEARANNQAAQEANPGTYTTGQVTGAIGTGIATGGTSIPALAGIGAIQGLGSSEADLTQGDVHGAIRDTAIGTTIGAATGGIGKAIGAVGSKVMPKAISALEEVATNPMISKAAQFQPQAKVSGMASNLLKKVGADIPGLETAASVIGNTAGRKAAYAIPGVNIGQGISDLALGAQKATQLTLEQIIPRMGKYSQVLSKAAQRGSASLAASDYVLQQQDQEYRELKRKAQE